MTHTGILGVFLVVIAWRQGKGTYSLPEREYPRISTYDRNTTLRLYII
jgi:hypothetical protein